jgi:predicted nucleic acid-binding protein
MADIREDRRYRLSLALGSALGQRERIELLPTNESDHQRAAAILKSYSQLRLSYVDALLLGLAERHRIEELITVDMRHFGAVKLAHRMVVTRV